MLKHQVDFEKGRRIAVTGSAMPLTSEGQESGVGRWHTIKLATLSFFEYLQIKNIELPRIPGVSSLVEVFSWSQPERIRVGEAARPLVAHFHEIPVARRFSANGPRGKHSHGSEVAAGRHRGQSPETRYDGAVWRASRFGNWRRPFSICACMIGGILDMSSLSSSLEVKKPTANSFLDVLEAAHLIYKLPPYGYGKKILERDTKSTLLTRLLPGASCYGEDCSWRIARDLAQPSKRRSSSTCLPRYYATSIAFPIGEASKAMKSTSSRSPQRTRPL